MKRILFYILSFTWGIIMSLIGLIAILIMACLGKGKLHKFHGRLYVSYGQNWGGLDLGCFFICAENCQYEDLLAHEMGHGLQNIIWGPLFPFVIAIPSAIRYWIFEFRSRKGKPNPDYDSIWFEGQATSWGKKYILTDKI